MFRATWGEARRPKLRRIAAERAWQLFEDGALSITGERLEVAETAHLRCVFVGRLVGVPAQAAPSRILDGYARAGLAALAQLHGEYLVLLSDGRRAWIARDRLGAYTVSYSARAGEVALGEHDSDVLDLLPATPSPDRLAVVQRIESGTLPAGRSLFEGVRHLPVGHVLELSDNVTREVAYWQPTYRGVGRDSRGDLADALRDATFAAVGRAREGAARPGLFLSGGIDSAAVAAALANTEGAPARAIAITYPLDHEVDESPQIAATAAFAGLPLTPMAFRGGDLLPAAMRHLERWKVPAPSPMLMVWDPLWSLARELDFDVMLDGQGGDEAFGALAAKFLISDRLRSGRFASAWRLAGALPGPGHSERMALDARLQVFRRIGLAGALPARLQNARRQRLPRERLVSGLVRDEDVRSLVASDDPWRFKLRDGPLWWRAVVALFLDQPDAMDANGFFRRDAADAGIERRQPFLHDVELFDHVLRTPPETAFDAARDRPLLRDALAGYVVEDIRTRHVKLIFNALFVSRMSGREGETLAAEILRPDAPVREYVNATALDGLFRPPAPGRGDIDVRSVQLFGLGMTNRWLKLLEAPTP
jgi:asparagine synthetase B (glutamine-hydrolysing)